MNLNSHVSIWLVTNGNLHYIFLTLTILLAISPLQIVSSHTKMKMKMNLIHQGNLLLHHLHSIWWQREKKYYLGKCKPSQSKERGSCHPRRCIIAINRSSSNKVLKVRKCMFNIIILICEHLPLHRFLPDDHMRVQYSVTCSLPAGPTQHHWWLHVPR